MLRLIARAVFVLLILSVPDAARAAAPPPAVITMVVSDGASFAATWNAAPSSTYYMLWIADSDGIARHQLWYTSSQVGCASASTCQKVLALPLKPGATSVWVQTWNADGYGDWSPEYKTLTQFGLPRVVDANDHYVGTLVGKEHVLIDYQGAPVLVNVYLTKVPTASFVGIYYDGDKCSGTAYTLPRFPRFAFIMGSNTVVLSGNQTDNVTIRSQRSMTDGGPADCFFDMQPRVMSGQTFAIVPTTDVLGPLTLPFRVVR
jgi:hypothetical protein